MGVHGLWSLLQSTGRPVTLESLDGKVLAVDVSMWMHQTMKGMRDRHGNPIPNAHLIGLYHRICKMLYYRIKPIFVFDGGVPLLKKQTIAARRQRKEEADDSSNKAAKKLLSNLLKHQAVSAILGSTPSTSQLTTASPSKSKGPDIFELKPLPETDRPFGDSRNDEVDDSFDIRMEQRALLHSEFQDLEDVNIESEDFSSLPPEIRHDILTELKENRKHNHYADIESLPSDSGDFSSFQMKKLMNQSKLSQKIEDIRKELNSQGTGEVASGLLGHGKQDGHRIEAQRVVSEDTSHSILITGLSKKKQEEVADALADQERAKEYMNQKVDEHDYWVEKRRAEANLPRVDDCLPKSRRPVQDYTFSSEESDSEVEDAKDVSKRVITDFSNEGGFFRDEDEDEEKSDRSHRKRKNSNLPHENLEEKKSCINNLSEKTGVIIPKEEMNAVDEVEEEVNDDELAELVVDEGKFAAESPQPSGSSEYVAAVPEIKGGCQATDDSGKSESSDDNDDDDDFIEVSFNPAAAKPDDELFPANIFETRADQLESPPSIEIKDLSHDELENEEAKEVVNAEAASGSPPAKEEDSFDNEFDGMSKDELADLQMVLEMESSQLQQKKGQQERAATSITDQMNLEAQELVRLFGLPYVVSPMEAEAQCAFLDCTSQTDGTVTDDSDIWLFGGKNVYKNVFNARKHVEWFRVKDIEAQLMLDRTKLINLALICGSDYTTGIQGAGPVTAMEVMGEFKGEGLEPLKRFRAWWDEAQSMVKVKETKIKSKLRNLELKEGFPNEAVVDAYMNPAVDESKEPFSWGLPDLDLLRQYASDKFGWSKDKTDETLLPVMKQLNAKQSQLRITSFFPSEMAEPRKLKSKRVKRILNVIRNPEPGVSNPGPKSKKKQDGAKHRLKTSSKSGGGFVNQQKAPPNEVQLSESSSDEFDDYEDEVDDTALAAIDIEAFGDGAQESKTKESANVKGKGKSSKKSSKGKCKK